MFAVYGQDFGASCNRARAGADPHKQAASTCRAQPYRPDSRHQVTRSLRVVRVFSPQPLYWWGFNCASGRADCITPVAWWLIRRHPAFWFSFNRQQALGPKDRQLIAPSVRAGGCGGCYLSAEGAPRFVPALRASGLSRGWGSPPSRTGLLTAGPPDLGVQNEPVPAFGVLKISSGMSTFARRFSFQQVGQGGGNENRSFSTRFLKLLFNSSGELSARTARYRGHTRH